MKLEKIGRLNMDEDKIFIIIDLMALFIFAAVALALPIWWFSKIAIIVMDLIMFGSILLVLTYNGE